MTMSEYTISVSNNFDADSPKEAVMQMVSWLEDSARQAGYRWDTESFISTPSAQWQNTGFIDMEKECEFGRAIKWERMEFATGAHGGWVAYGIGSRGYPWEATISRSPDNRDLFQSRVIINHQLVLNDKEWNYASTLIENVEAVIEESA